MDEKILQKWGLDSINYGGKDSYRGFFTAHTKINVFFKNSVQFYIQQGSKKFSTKFLLQNLSHRFFPINIKIISKIAPKNHWLTWISDEKKSLSLFEIKKSWTERPKNSLHERVPVIETSTIEIGWLSCNIPIKSSRKWLSCKIC